MSVGPTGMASSVVGTAQSRGSEVERTEQDAAAQQRRLQSTDQAEAAEGVGETTEDQESQDRDADGRRLWEQGAPTVEGDAATDQAQTQRSRDVTGDRGTKLDLSG